MARSESRGKKRMEDDTAHGDDLSRVVVPINIVATHRPSFSSDMFRSSQVVVRDHTFRLRLQ